MHVQGGLPSDVKYIAYDDAGKRLLATSSSSADVYQSSDDGERWSVDRFNDAAVAETPRLAGAAPGVPVRGQRTGRARVGQVVVHRRGRVHAAVFGQRQRDFGVR